MLLAKRIRPALDWRDLDATKALDALIRMAGGEPEDV
jgi:hypothetical protein